jgi:subtilisin
LKRTLSSILLLIIILASSVLVSTTFAAPEGKIPVIIGFKDLPDAALIHAHGGKITYEYGIIPAIACSLPAQAINALKNNPHVAYIEEDFQVTALEYKVGSEDWGITQIGANTVHLTDKGADIKVAVIDTGINKLHEDLQNRYKGGYNFLNPASEPIDDNGHGTHCAGIIAASFNGIAVVGVAPEASIYAYKVLNSQGSGTVSNIIAAINRAVADKVQVISMSLGSSSYSQGLYDACLAAYQNNIVVVASAGNSGNTATGSTVNYPAKFACVIAVGATDINDKLATFSSTGPEVDVVAPGVSILSDYKDVTPNDGMNRDVVYMSGTSMACPHVAGTAALMLKANPSLTPAQVQGILQATAIDKGNSGFDNYYGYGRINAAQAVAQAANPDITPPAKVTELTGTAASATQINLIWKQNSETDLKGYNIYRGNTENQISLLKFVSAPTNSYIDSGLTASTAYYYKVAAVDNAGNEGVASDTALVTTLQSQQLFASITMALKTSWLNTYATATVKIVDINNLPVSGVVVTGKWSGATNDVDSASTGTNGQVTLQSNNVRNAKSGTTFTFTITAATKTGYTLNPTSEISDFIKK